MAKNSVDSYLSKFDRYGNGKTKVKKKKDGGKRSKGKKDKKLSKSLKKSVQTKLDTMIKNQDNQMREFFTKLETNATALTEMQSVISMVETRVEALEKLQKTTASQVKTLGKVQKTLKKDLEEATDSAGSTPGAESIFSPSDE